MPRKAATPGAPEEKEETTEAQDGKSEGEGKTFEIECTEICTFNDRLYKPGMKAFVQGTIPPHFKKV